MSKWLKIIKRKKERFPHTLRELTAPTLDIMCAALRDVVCYGDLIAAAMLSSTFSSFFSVKTLSDDEMRSVSVSYSIHIFLDIFSFSATIKGKDRALSTYSTLYAQHLGKSLQDGTGTFRSSIYLWHFFSLTLLSPNQPGLRLLYRPHTRLHIEANSPRCLLFGVLFECYSYCLFVI